MILIFFIICIIFSILLYIPEKNNWNDLNDRINAKRRIELEIYRLKQLYNATNSVEHHLIIKKRMIELVVSLKQIQILY